MGDRVLFQIKKTETSRGDTSTEFSPIAYGHWCGERAPQIVAALRTRMAVRLGDVSYTFARLVQEMCAGDNGAISFGVWNADGILESKDSHGDAGIVLIDLTNGFHCICVGGYLTIGADGLPVVDAAAA